MANKIEITVLSVISAGDVFRFNLEEGGSIKIGRSSECDVVLQDQSVSRNHARIDARTNGLFLTDLGSSQGTVHMGFQLKKGDEGTRQFHDGDEFKIATSIFRIGFDEDRFRPTVSAVGEGASGTQRVQQLGMLQKFSSMPSKKKKRLVIFGTLAAVLLGILLFAPSGSGGGLPPQNTAPLSVPQKKVAGYIMGPADEGGSDNSRLDKATFKLPGSDMVVDFDFKSEAPVDIRLDQAFVITLEPSTTWDHKQIVIRDLLLGRERELIFDNTDYPRKAGASGQKLKRWGVRNLRIVPLSHDRAVNVSDQLSTALAVGEGMESTPPGLALAIKAFHHALLAQISELNQDAVAYSVSVETDFPNAVEVRDTMSRMISERKTGSSTDIGGRHLTVLTSLTGRLEAELWRRVTSRMTKAKLAAGAKNNIDAHDILLATLSLFPDDTDFRYTLVTRMFNDPEIVPKAVQKNPGKFRKKKAAID